MKNSLTIIIITFNSQNYIESCLKSIKKQGLTPNILIIDNNSTDNTWEKLQKIKNSNIVLIKNKNNKGFAKTVNQGIKYANKRFKHSFYLLLNPDATLDKNCLKNLIRMASSNSQIGLCSPIIKSPINNKIIFQQGKINWLKMRTSHSIQPRTQLNYLTGCCLLIKKAVIDEIDGFDERFFLYYEDVDFCLRACQANFKIKTISSAVCFHQESQSSNSKTKTYHLVKSGLIFFYKNFSHLTRLLYFWPIFWFRLFYHTLISRKKPVITGMQEFLKLHTIKK